MTTPTDLPSTKVLVYPPPAQRVTRDPKRPAPLGSLVASARRLTSETIPRQGSNAKPWQEDAWEMYGLVGEQRFLSTTLAGRLSQARLYVGELSDEDPTDDPIPVEDEQIVSVLEAVGNTTAVRAQMIERMAVNLYIAGDGWFVGIPKYMLPSTLQPAVSLEPLPEEEMEELPVTTLLDIQDLEWRMLSVSEVATKAAGLVSLKLGNGEGETIEVNPNDIMLVRVWRGHPRYSWEADSPTRSSLPVLRELVGLTMHISAQVDSRLAGAGLLLVPQSAKQAINTAAGLPQDTEEDPFTDALIEAMLTPIKDRANASALVPLVVTVPDEAVEKFKYITFAKPLDTESRNLREEAIRRLALQEDAPPELLLGTGGMNHWGAWLVQDDVVSTHLEPPLALMCDALTTQYLWPVLNDMGMNEEQAQRFVIWYDVSHLRTRPNHNADAFELHSRGAISDEALRTATGFDESDAPWLDQQNLDPWVRIAFDLVRQQPSLAASPGIPALADQIRATLSGEAPPAPVAPPASPPGEEEEPTAPPSNTPPLPEGPPSTQGQPAQPPGIAASLVTVGAM